jgi:hypothetical protein
VPTEACPFGPGNCCQGAFGHFGLTCARVVIQSVSGAARARRP